MRRNVTRNGRQVIHMIYEWFRTNDYMSTVYGISELMDLAWRVWHIISGPRRGERRTRTTHTTTFVE